MILDKSESKTLVSQYKQREEYGLPFATSGRMLDDCLTALDITKPNTIGIEHVIGGIWVEPSNVDVLGLSGIFEDLLKAATARVLCEDGRDSKWDGRLGLRDS